MDVKDLRMMLKGCADDTRLRILNLVLTKELSVKEITSILNFSQSRVSRHLSRLRFLRILTDHRRGSTVFYRLSQNIAPHFKDIIQLIITSSKDFETFRKDIDKITGKDLSANTPEKGV